MNRSHGRKKERKEEQKKPQLISNLPKLTIAINNSFTKPDQQKATPAPSPEIQFSDITK
jgi:hypothetical protein